jgi:hypothetical protein
MTPRFIFLIVFFMNVTGITSFWSSGSTQRLAPSRPEIEPHRLHFSGAMESCLNILAGLRVFLNKVFTFCSSSFLAFVFFSFLLLGQH